MMSTEVHVSPVYSRRLAITLIPLLKKACVISSLHKMLCKTARDTDGEKA